MAEEDQDDSQRTEEPSQRRLQEAREKGQVAQSREVQHWIVILGVALAIFIFAGQAATGTARLMLPFLERPETIPFDFDNLRWMFAGIVFGLVKIAVLPLLVLIIAAMAGGLIQTGFVFSGEQLKPKLERISPIEGAKRLFSRRSLAEFAKNLAKLGVVGTVAVMVLWPMANDAARLIGLDQGAVLGLMQHDSMRLLIALLAIMALIAALDYLYQYFEHIRRLRMSKRELREELKQSEGDPLIKSRIRQLRMERARRRMMAQVPKADVVITNPTHFAVALKYEVGRMAAPVLIAKGADAVAFRIRELAEAHKIPVVENPPLARGLFASVELDEEIPAEHYKAVAEVIGYVMRLRGNRPPVPAAARR
jgi:flagellar biosynthetic protein FlhB